MTLSGVELTPKQEAFVAQKVASGEYADAEQVVRAALDNLQETEAEEHAKMEALEEDLAIGFASGIAEGDVFAQVRERAGLPPRVRS